jgi:hypothetical protein
MVQPRNRSHCDADAVLTAEGNIRHTGMRGVVGIAGVASTGHAYKGTFREPRRAPCLSAYLGLGVAQPKDTWSPGGEGCPREKRTTSSGVSCGQGKNYRNLEKFVHAVRRIWRQWLARRTRGRRLPWLRFNRLLARYPLLRPRITHAWAVW